MLYLIKDELVDTYGGDFTYRDVWCEVEKENGEDIMYYYEQYYGAKPTEAERITDPKEIEELKIILMGFYII